MEMCSGQKSHRSYKKYRLTQGILRWKVFPYLYDKTKKKKASLIKAMGISEGYPIKMGPTVVTYFLHW